MDKSRHTNDFFASLNAIYKDIAAICHCSESAIKQLRSGEKDEIPFLWRLGHKLILIEDNLQRNINIVKDITEWLNKVKAYHIDYAIQYESNFRAMECVVNDKSIEFGIEDMSKLRKMLNDGGIATNLPDHKIINILLDSQHRALSKAIFEWPNMNHHENHKIKCITKARCYIRKKIKELNN